MCYPWDELRGMCIERGICLTAEGREASKLKSRVIAEITMSNVPDGTRWPNGTPNETNHVLTFIICTIVPGYIESMFWKASGSNP